MQDGVLILSESVMSNYRELKPLRLEIRRFQKADENEVIRLWRGVLSDGAPHNDPATVIRCKFRVNDGLFYVAAIDGKVVGTVMGGYDGHRGWIYSVAVDARFRRKQIATGLMRHVQTALQERGCLKVNLQVRVSNAGAIALYKKLGFQIEERVSMGKRLYA